MTSCSPQLWERTWGLTPVPRADLSSRLSSILGLGRTDEGMAGPSTTDPGTKASHGWILHPEPPARPGAIAPHGLPAIPGYEILEKLGEGGMGVVYKARQLGLNRLVALKMIRGGSQARPDHFARFRIEAEAVARLRHPNILQIYDIGEVDGLPFVSLELLEGGSLADRLAGTPQPARQAAELLMTLARAVQVAHDAGIVHRDLKPSNVLFTADGIPKITDFGLAKRLDSDSRQTETGQIMGSPSYMAPEQARGHTRDVGPAADVYALGAILYEMLTGRPPFKGETPMETVRQVIDDEVVPPSRLVPKVARDLETICLKCLNKEPSRRYASASELAEDLDRYRKGEIDPRAPRLARRARGQVGPPSAGRGRAARTRPRGLSGPDRRRSLSTSTTGASPRSSRASTSSMQHERGQRAGRQGPGSEHGRGTLAGPDRALELPWQPEQRGRPPAEDLARHHQGLARRSGPEASRAAQP